MRVLITSPRGKEKLCAAFEAAGAELVTELTSDVKLIVPTVDEEMWFFSRGAPYFRRQGIQVMVSNDYTVQMCRDKAEFYRFCRRHDFATPYTMQEDFIIKPRFGKGSKGIVKIDKSFICQPIVKEPELSIDYFADWQGNALSIIPRFRENVVNGESQAFSIVPNFDFVQVKRIGQELNLIGHNVIQGFWDGSRMLFTEVNLRFGGGSWMTFESFNSPNWLMKNL